MLESQANKATDDLGKFVMNKMLKSTMEQQLSSQELASMPEVVKMLKKAPGEPIYQRDII